MAARWRQHPAPHAPAHADTERHGGSWKKACGWCSFVGVKKCQICGKRATLFLTQIVNAQVTELCLCESCAKERGLFDPQALTFAEKFFPEELKERVDRIVRELSGQAAGQSPMRELPADIITQCPACGFTLEDYRRTSRLGCPDCYSFFAREFAGLATVQADAPEGHEADAPPSREKLERQLREAVEREDYESAARLRDEIKALS